MNGLKAMVIDAVRERAAHPYAVAQLLESRGEQRLVSLRRSTLYSSFTSLEKQGWITPVGLERDGHRPERCLYEATPSGVAHLKSWVQDTLRARRSDAGDFAVAVGLAHVLPRPAAIAAFLAVVSNTQTQLRELDELRRQTSSAAVSEALWLDLPFTRALTKAKIDWFGTALERMQGDGIDWPADE